MDNHRLFDLTGRVALVTGGSGGIGGALALGLGRAGARIALNARSQAPLQAQANALEAAGIEASVFPGDVSQVEDGQTLVDAVLASMGQIDVLVNVAGINRRKPAVEFTEQDWDAVIGVNLKGLFFISQAVGRYWLETRRFAPERQGGKGKIINIASIASYQSGPGRALYAASKTGVLGVTRALAVEWAKAGVCVNALAPGYVETELTRSLFEDQTFQNWLQNRVPMNRVARPEDLVGAAIFLAAPASDYMTGQIMVVDGGLLAAM